MINFCDVAAEAKGEINPNCETNYTRIFDYLDLCRISHKFVRQYFNPKEYEDKNGEMSYLGENRIIVDFIRDVTPRNNYNVMTNFVTYYSNRFIDLSAFDFIDSSRLEHNFFASKFDGYTQMTY